MATSWINAYDLALGDATFLKRVRMSMIKAAKDIQAEDNVGLPLPAGYPSPKTDQDLHNERAFLAYNALRSPDQFAPLFAQAVAVVSTITAASTDADLDSAVAGAWNALAVKLP